MKIVKYNDIVENVAKLCKEACCIVTPDMKEAFLKAKESEKISLGKSIIEKIIQNSGISANTGVAFCVKILNECCIFRNWSRCKS